MSRDDFEELKSGAYRRRVKRKLGLFIDGVGLDRATRRLERKVDLARLVGGLCSGLTPEVARYYTLIPHEDDARQFAFLDAVERAGLKVIVKRLPPKGVKRQVSMDVHMATDLMNFSVGVYDDLTAPAPERTEHSQQSIISDIAEPTANGSSNGKIELSNGATSDDLMKKIRSADQNIRRLAVVVCPSRELSYAIDQSHLLGVEMSLADFGLYGTSDGWKGVDRWVDLSTSETIWRG